MKLSACMIVRDEERLLGQCLGSIREYVDEIIVVDTGSTDRTIAIAKAYGADVYEHPWQKDFSLHRNQSIAYATGDWFLIIDADEKLAVTAYTPIEDLKKRFEKLPDDVCALLFTVLCQDRFGRTKNVAQGLRFFRNGVGVKYKGYVHNYAVLPPNMVAVPTDFEIVHYGYDLPPDVMAGKFKRSSELLYKKIKETPDDPKPYFYLSNLLACHSKWEEAVEAGNKCLELLSEEDMANDRGPFVALYHTIGMLYFLRLNDYDSALEVIRRGIELYPESLDLNYDMIHIADAMKDGNEGWLSEDIRKYGEKYLELHDFLCNNPHEAGTKSLMTLNAACRAAVEGWLNETNKAR
jgi:glycosyltransferase involved in cell wall biosynthesis